MALLIKNVNSPRAAGTTGSGFASVRQWIHVARSAAVLPQSTTEMLFRVFNGRVAAGLLVGEATVILTSVDPGLSLNHTKLNNVQPLATVGTTTIMNSTVSLASLEVGGLAVCSFGGGAVVKANAGGNVSVALNNSFAILSAGELYITTTGNNTTGQIKWDLWYQPLDEGAFVVAQPAGTAII